MLMLNWPLTGTCLHLAKIIDHRNNHGYVKNYRWRKKKGRGGGGGEKVTRDL